MKDTVCITPGCWIRIKAHERYCLACRLDMGIETGHRRKPGRPVGTFKLANGYSSRCITYHHTLCAACGCGCHQQDRGAAA
jgi:hypothetical protein